MAATLEMKSYAQKGLSLAIQSIFMGSCLIVLPTTVFAENPPLSTSTAKNIKIAAGPLDTALAQFAGLSNIELSYDPALVTAKKTKGLNGSYTFQQGIAKLLEGTDLQLIKLSDGTWTIQKIKNQVRDMGQLNTIDVNSTGLARNNNNVAQLPLITVNADQNGRAEDGYLVKNLKKVGPWGEKSLQDTPYSMTVMSEDLIANTIAGDIDQLYKMNPLIGSLDSVKTWTTPYVSYRGFSNSKALLDGISFSSNLYNISPEEMERVEFISGLTGFMYGIGNVGGTSNYILKRPTYEKLTNLTVGNYGGDQYFAHIDLGDKIDQEGQFAYRLNTVYSNGDTSIEGEHIEKKLLSGAVDWNINDDLLLQLEAGYQKWRMEGSSSYILFPDREIGKAFDADKKRAPDWTFSDTESKRIGLNLNYKINDIFSLRSAYLYKEEESVSSQIRSFFYAAGNYRNVITEISPTYGETHAGNIYLDGEFNTGSIAHKLTLGVSADRYIKNAHQKANNVTWVDGYTFDNYTTIPKPSAFDYGMKYKSNAQENINVVLGDDITFNENWSALVGVNYSTIKTKAFDTEGKILISWDGAKQIYEKSALTPTLSLMYKPFDELTTYATYMESLEQGTIVGETYKNKGEVFDPLISKQYEIGTKYAISDSLLLSSALFRIEKANQYSDDGTTLGTWVQDGRAIHEGIELSLTGKLTEYLTVMTGGTVLDLSIDQSNNANLQGKQPTGVVSKLAKLYAEYRVPEVEGLVFTGGAYYTGKQYKDEMNKFEIPAYTVFDAGVRYSTQIAEHPTTFNLNVTNLTNKNYWASTYLTLGNPRTVAFSVKTQF